MDDELEALIRRPKREQEELVLPPPAGAAEAIGQCVCGARVSRADVYSQRGDLGLGRPRRNPSPLVYLYRCPLCGHMGELEAAGG
jgi:hypothetical protein